MWENKSATCASGRPFAGDLTKGSIQNTPQGSHVFSNMPAKKPDEVIQSSTISSLLKENEELENR